MEKEVIFKIQKRRDKIENWTTNNPILLKNEYGYLEEDERYKIGDGSTSWNDLEFHGMKNITNELGNDPDLGIGQKIFTEKLNKIETDLNVVLDRINNTYSYYGVEKSRSTITADFTAINGTEENCMIHPILKDYKICKVKDGKIIDVLNPVNWFKTVKNKKSNIVIDGTSVKDDGSDIMFCNTTGFYAILGGKNPETEIYAVGYKPFTYKGQVAQYIAPYGEGPDYSIVKDKLQRSIRDNSFPGTKGNSGKTWVMPEFDENGYPTTAYSRFGYESAARMKNTADHSDNFKNVPYSNTFQLDLKVWATLLFIKFKTKDLHASDHAGNAISAASKPSAETWGKVTGFRTRTAASAEWAYSSFTSSAWSNNINGYKPLLRMFDAQLALSHAYEKNIQPGVEFTCFDTDKTNKVTYIYHEIPGQNSLKDGEMTAIVSKIIISADGNAELCLSLPIICGKVAGWGNLYKWHSGIDCVANGSTVTDKIDTYDIYQTDDINLVPTDNDSAEKTATEKYDFESTLDFVGNIKKDSGYVSKMHDDSLMGKEFSGDLHTHDCAYQYFTGYVANNGRQRKGVLFGLFASNSTCALRSCVASANDAPAVTIFNYGGGFRVSLTTAEAQI